MLTRRQRELLVFIAVFIAKHGKSPRRKNMAYALGIKSCGHIGAILDSLEERGFIARPKPRCKCAIEVLKMPPGPLAQTKEGE